MNPLGSEARPAGGASSRPSPWPVGGFLRLLQFALGRFVLISDRFIPAACEQDPELARHARLISRFSILGALFGLVYACFYSLIGHYWGAGIIVVCSAAFIVVPPFMRRSGSLRQAGNTLSLILILGFTALCFFEGGVQGHAIAWLASVPLCALLLVGSQAARWWVVASLGAGAIVVAGNLLGYHMHPSFDPAWELFVATAGYLGLILFMFILGMIFETGRERAFGKMRDALQQLEASNQELVWLNQEKNEFLGIAAHDLKNPLTAIIGSAELLLMRPDSPRAPDITRNIISAGTRMVTLIKDLLDANAIEQGKFSSNLECCNLRALASEAIANNQAAAERKTISLRLEEPAGQGDSPDEPLWAKADRAATLQVLDNLLSNSVKYSPLNTTVHLRAFAAAGQISVAIRDEGPGISPEDQKKLFQKFTRLTARPTAGESSTGLGLSIVKRLAEAMRGTVQCHSTLGHGATFTLSLPAWDGPAPAPGISPAPATVAVVPIASAKIIALPRSEAISPVVPSLSRAG